MYVNMYIYITRDRDSDMKVNMEIDMAFGIDS